MPCLVNSCRISHFGINPVRGGSPPRDSIVIMTRVVRIGAFVQLVASVLIFVEEVIFNAIKAVLVMTI